MARNQVDVSERSVIPTRGILFQRASTNKGRNGLRWSSIMRISLSSSSSSNVTYSRHDIDENLFIWW